MSSKRVNVSVPSELFDRMESARGDVSRSKFVQRALESALGRAESVDASFVRSSEPERVVGSSAPDPVSTRAPEPYKLPPSEPSPKPVAGVRRASSLLSGRQAALNKAKKS